MFSEQVAIWFDGNGTAGGTNLNADVSSMKATAERKRRTKKTNKNNT